MEKVFEARTEQEAVEAAIREFGVNAEFIEVEVLQKTKGGLLGKSGKVVIKASVLGLPSQEDHAHDLASEAQRNESKPATEDVSDEIKAQICDIVQNLIAKMGIDIECKFKIEDDFYVVEMEALHEDDQNLLIGKHGKNIESIQNISNSIIQNQVKNFPSHIVVDLENYRSKRSEWLGSIARKKSSYVLKTGKPCLLDELGPFDRKLIHNIIKQIEGIATESKGDGYYKRIKIFLEPVD